MSSIHADDAALLPAGTPLTCSFGSEPAGLRLLPRHESTPGSESVARADDHVAHLNIPPFGLCTSPANPVVAAMTAAALGRLTPTP